MRGLDSIVLPFGRVCCGEHDASAKRSFTAGSHDAVIRVYDDAGNVIETHEQVGEFHGVVSLPSLAPAARRMNFLINISFSFVFDA